MKRNRWKYLLTLGMLMLVTLMHGQSWQSDFNELSEELLRRIQKGEDTKPLQNKLASVSVEALDAALATPEQQLAFWVNVYNAYIQIILRANPELYEDRSSFFTKDQIRIAGETVSFDKIEHGLIRKSQSKLGLGYVGKLFPGSFEKTLQVDKLDYRIHFALNCGARDCPPVAIYEPERLEEQFSKGTKRYLQGSSRYDAASHTVYVTSLFSWFRGDFGGKDGVRSILESNGIVPRAEDLDLEFKDYDWTLFLDNFTKL